MNEVSLAKETETFDTLLPALRRDYGRAWVVIIGEACEGGFHAFDEAARFALSRFAELPFLIAHTDDVPPQFPFLFVES